MRIHLWVCHTHLRSPISESVCAGVWVYVFWNGRSHTNAHMHSQHVIIKIKGSNANVKRQKHKIRKCIYFLNFGGELCVFFCVFFCETSAQSRQLLRPASQLSPLQRPPLGRPPLRNPSPFLWSQIAFECSLVCVFVSLSVCQFRGHKNQNNTM